MLAAVTCRRTRCLAALLLAVVCAPGQDVDLRLIEPQWTTTTAPGAQAAWGNNAVRLATTLGSQCYAVAKSKQTLNQDFEASLAFELLDWSPGSHEQAVFGFGVVSSDRTVSLSRAWDGAVENYNVAAAGQVRWNYSATAMAVLQQGRLKFVRRGAMVQAMVEEDGVQHTLQRFSIKDPAEPLGLQIAIGNGQADDRTHPSLQVRLSDLQVRILPKPNRPGGQSQQPPGPDQPEYVIYATGPGWLRVGSVAQFQEPWALRNEIFGGNSNEPLPKELLRRGFASRADALEYLCERLTRVRVNYSPTATPKEWAEGMFEDQNYNLRLVGGGEHDEDLPRGMSYDFQAERKVLADHGLTPRRYIGRLWLIHITGHNTRQGLVKEDEWVLFSGEPLPNPKDPKMSYFLKPDGRGGTFTYHCDDFIGPFRDDFGLALAMRQRGIAELELYPPANSKTPKIYAAEIPEAPRDYGPKVPGVQPIVDPAQLRDWVVYVTEGQWLHIGTRTELMTVVLKKDTIWAGTSDALSTKQQVDFGRPFVAYEQALDALLQNVTEITIGYHPNNQPRETVQVKLAGQDFIAQLARSPYQLVAGYKSYNLGAEIDVMLHHGKVPVKKFGAQYMVHATGHGTYSGPVKDDHWMMVASQPKDGHVAIPDGTGGTYTYSVDQVKGPFTDSLAVARELQNLKLKSINLAGSYRSISLDDMLLAAPPPKPKPTKILSVTPDRGEAGEQFYVTVIAEGMKPWYSFTFGPGVTVTDPTCLGVDAETGAERWLATLTIGPGATFRGGR